MGGDERDGDVPDPADPDIVYGAGLGGRISKWDRRTGQVQNVSPWPVSSYAERPGTTRYRYDWITPLAIAPRPPHPIYVGAQMLFRSGDGGHAWETISPDLTGAIEGETGYDGDVTIERATECGFGVIFAIAASPAADGLIWAGTTNGRVQITRDDGAHWTDVTPPGIGDWTKVNIIDPSAIDPATAYVAADRHRRDDRRPIAYRTHDFGRSWSEIGHGLPEGAWVGVVRHDPERPGLLYAGTSRGVHVSFDDGDTWRNLKLNLPTTGINDLLVHDGDLIVATQGRAIWILDNVAPLRTLAAGAGADIGETPVLVPPGVAYRLRGNSNKDTPLPLEEPRGDNRPAGAILDYILPPDASGPVNLEIVDAGGRTIRSFRSDEEPARPEARIYFAEAWLGAPPLAGDGPGHHRFVWDLRLAAPATLESEYSIAAVPGKAVPAPQGAFVLPGHYRVRLLSGGRTIEQPLEVVMDPRCAATPEDLSALSRFQSEVAAALERAVGIARLAEETSKAIEAMRRRDVEAVLREALASTADLLATARGDGDASAAGVAADLTSLATDLESADAAPTEPQRQLLALSAQRLGGAERRWRTLEDGALRDLRERLEKAGLTLSGEVEP